MTNIHPLKLRYIVVPKKFVRKSILKRTNSLKSLITILKRSLKNLTLKYRTSDPHVQFFMAIVLLIT